MTPESTHLLTTVMTDTQVSHSTRFYKERMPKSFQYKPLFCDVYHSFGDISSNIAFVFQIVLCSTRECQIQYHAYTSSCKLIHRQYAECFHRHVGQPSQGSSFSILIIIRGVNNLLFSICVIYGALEVKGCQSNMHQTTT